MHKIQIISLIVAKLTTKQILTLGGTVEDFRLL
jgi:hypothetical protein